MIFFSTATLVFGWHFGGSNRAPELWNAVCATFSFNISKEAKIAETLSKAIRVNYRNPHFRSPLVLYCAKVPPCITTLRPDIRDRRFVAWLRWGSILWPRSIFAPISEIIPLMQDEGGQDWARVVMSVLLLRQFLYKYISCARMQCSQPYMHPMTAVLTGHSRMLF